MADNQHPPLWDAVNALRERTTRSEEKAKALASDVAKLEKRIARLEMGVVALGVAAVYVVWTQIATTAGIPL